MTGKPKTTPIWVKGNWVEVFKDDMVAVETGVKYVREPESGHWIPESELKALKASVRSELVIRTTTYSPELIMQRKNPVQIPVGKRPFSVDYGDIRDDDPHKDDIHEIGVDLRTGFAYEFRKLDDEEFIRKLLVNVPIREISLVPQDHSRYTEHMGKGSKVRRRV